MPATAPGGMCTGFGVGIWVDAEVEVGSDAEDYECAAQKQD